MGDRIEIDFESDLKDKELPDFESDLLKVDLPDFESDLPDFESDIPVRRGLPDVGPEPGMPSYGRVQPEVEEIGQRKKNVLERIGEFFGFGGEKAKKKEGPWKEKGYVQWPGITDNPALFPKGDDSEINKLRHWEVDRILNGEIPLPKEGIGAITDPAVRVALDNAIDSEEERARLAAAENLSMITGIDVIAYNAEMQDSLMRAWLDEDEKTPVTKLHERMYLQAQHAIDIRNITDLYFQKYVGNDSEELQAKIDKAESQLTPTDPYEGGFLEQAWRGTLDQVFGHYWKAAQEAGVWASGLGIAGAGLGLLFAGPAGAATAFKGGVSLGLLWGRRKGFAEYEVASAYRDFLTMRDEEGNPLDPVYCRIGATTTGLANAFIEEMQWMTAFKGAGVSNAVHRGMLKTLTSPKWTANAARFFKRASLVWTTEMVEEEFQTLQTMAQSNIYKEVSNVYKGTEFASQHNMKEVLDAVWETAKQSAGPMLLMSGAGAATQAVKGQLIKETVKPKTGAAQIRELREKSQKLDEMYRGYVPGTKIEPTTEAGVKIAEEIETVTKEEEAIKAEVPAVTGEKIEKVKISTEEEFIGASKLILGEANSPTMEFIYGAEKQIGETKDAYTYITPKGELRGRVHNFDIVKWEKEDGTIRYLIHAKNQKGNQYSRPDAAAQFMIENGKPKLLTIASAEKRIGLGTRLLQEIEKDYGEMSFNEPVSKSGAALLRSYLGKNWEERAMGEKIPVEMITEEVPAEEVIKTVPEEEMSEEELQSILDEFDTFVAEEKGKEAEKGEEQPTGREELTEKQVLKVNRLALEAARIDDRIEQIKKDKRFDPESRKQMIREVERHREDIHKMINSMTGLETGPATEEEFSSQYLADALGSLWNSKKLFSGEVRLPPALYNIAKNAGKKGGLVLSEGQYKTAMQYIKADPNRYRSIFYSLEAGVSPEVLAAYGGAELHFAGDQEFEDVIERGMPEEEIAEETEALDKAETEEDIEKTLRKDFSSKQADLISQITNIKQRIRVLTGQRKIGDERVGETYNEYKALKEQLKKEKRLSMAAFLVGEKAGKEHVRDIWSRYRQNRAKRELINKLTKVIMQKIGGNVDPGYIVAIENLRSGIDPHFRAEATLEKRARLKAFAEENPDLAKKIPGKLLRTAESLPLNDYTMDNLEDLANEINRLKTQGRFKKTMKDRLDKNVDTEMLSRVIDSITGGKELVLEGPEQHDIGKIEGKAGTVAFDLYLQSINSQRFFDLMDGGKKFKGANHELFYGGATEIKRQFLKERYERIGTFQEKLKDAGMKLAEFGKKRISIGDVDYNVEAAMDVYAKTKNVMSHAALRNGNKLTQKQIDKIVDSLTEKEKDIADWIIQEYDEWYPGLREFEVNFREVDPGHEQNYTPMRRLDVDHADLTMEMGDEIAMRKAYKKAYPFRGMLEKRKNIPEKYQHPIRLGVVSGWLDAMEKQAYYKASAKLVKQMHYIANNKDFLNSVRGKFGDRARPVIKRLHTYINQIARNSAFEDKTRLERAAKWAQKNTAIAYLSWSIKTILTQGPSVAFYAPYTGISRLLQSTVQMGFNWSENTKKMYDLDPEMKNRSIEQELQDLKTADLALHNRLIKKFGQRGMWGIMFMDKLATHTGWWAVFQKGMADGMSEQGAAREAHDVTLRTQPAFDIKDRAQMYNTSRFLNLVMQFTQQLNQNWNMLTYDMPMYLKKGDWKKAVGIVAAWTLSAQIIWMLSHRRPPENLEDLVDAEKESFIASVPIIGKTILSAAEGFGGGDVPILKGVGSTTTNTLDMISKGKITPQAQEGLSLMLGIPYTGIKRFNRFLKSGRILELIGGKPRR